MFLKPMPIFIGVIAFFIVIKFLLRKSNNGFDTAVDDFIKRESEANFTRKNFEELNLTYVTPVDDLPFKTYEDENKYKVLIKKQEMVKRKLQLEMIKLPKDLSNTDLKEMFGVNNFDKITILEEHYNSYIRALFEWGLELFNQDNLIDSEKVLLEAVRLDGNISQIYSTLSKIYTKQNNKSKLEDLKNKVENMDLSLKETALKNIYKDLESL